MLALVLKALQVIARQFFLTWHCFFVHKYNCVKFYKKLPWTFTEQSPRWKFFEPWNFLASFFTKTSQRTSFRVPEIVIKYFINNSDSYFFLRLDGSARVSEIIWWMFRIISLWTERVIYFKKHWFLIYAKTTFFKFYLENYLPDKKILNKKRCTSTRRANTYFLFRIFMHFNFLLVIGNVMSSSSVASPYSIRTLNSASGFFDPKFSGTDSIFVSLSFSKLRESLCFI